MMVVYLHVHTDRCRILSYWPEHGEQDSEIFCLPTAELFGPYEALFAIRVWRYVLTLFATRYR